MQPLPCSSFYLKPCRLYLIIDCSLFSLFNILWKISLIQDVFWRGPVFWHFPRFVLYVEDSFLTQMTDWEKKKARKKMLQCISIVAKNLDL
jgi:hypothetical protein